MRQSFYTGNREITECHLPLGQLVEEGDLSGIFVYEGLQMLEGNFRMVCEVFDKRSEVGSKEADAAQMAS